MVTILLVRFVNLLFKSPVYSGIFVFAMVYSNRNHLVKYTPFPAWYDSGFTRGLFLPLFRQ